MSWVSKLTLLLTICVASMNILLASNSCQDANLQSRFVAHRGANNEAPENNLTHFPENTLLALREAYVQGASYVECDVHMTRDRQIVVLHDTTLRRTARYRREMAATMNLDDFELLLDKEISSLTYEEISQIDVGSYADYFDSVLCTGAKIPLLTEFLHELQGHPEKKLLIEVKAGSDNEIVGVLSQLIEKYSAHELIHEEQLIFIRFDLNILKQLKQVLPNHKIIFLIVTTPEVDEVVPYPKNLSDQWKGLYHRIYTKEDLQRIIQLTKQANLDGLGIEYHPSFIDAAFVQKIKEHTLWSYIWTYPKDDNIQMASDMLNCGVDLIATNQPQKIFEQLKTR